MFSLIFSVISGAFIGWIASMFMNETGGFWKYAGIGIIGSFIANAICQFIGIYRYGSLFGMAANVLGACVFIWLLRKFR
ncbi:MAG: GlsB/YeaQ/YmgE family stress response membrane protein [Bacillota bacterium]|nr:GlsB/YeaQ/YmgE family stress response membrane protein [Bacillota bacterium]